MTRIAPVLAAVPVTPPAAAQQGQQGHGAPAPRAAAQEPASTRGFRAATDRMPRGMAIRFTGTADRDVAAGIPHHKGANAMATIVLRHGSDPEMRALAEAIIRAQEAEIAQLRAFLARTALR